MPETDVGISNDAVRNATGHGRDHLVSAGGSARQRDDVEAAVAGGV